MSLIHGEEGLETRQDGLDGLVHVESTTLREDGPDPGFGELDVIEV